MLYAFYLALTVYHWFTEIIIVTPLVTGLKKDEHKQPLFQKKNPHTRIWKKYSFQILYQNARSSLACLLPVLFLFLGYDSN